MRIVIDLQSAQSESRHRGIGRYSLSLALAMARLAGSHEIWLALNGAFPESVTHIRHVFDGLISPERIRVFHVPTPVSEVHPTNSWRVQAAETIREYFLHELKPDALHITSLFEGYGDNAVTSVSKNYSRTCTAVTLYDLIPLLNEEDYLLTDWQKKCYYRKIQSLKNAELLFAISEASRCEAIEALKIEEDRVINISGAAENRFCPLTLEHTRILELRHRYGLKREIIMYAPSGFDWRKNIDGLITAYSMLPPNIRANHQLMLVGRLNTEKSLYLNKLRTKAHLAKDELVMTDYVSDDVLVELYNISTLFVFPSKHEGFGLPALEAMACGTPTIGSKNSSIPEVISLEEALFDPYSPQDIAMKITQVLSNQSFKDQLRDHGLHQSQSFTWDKCAKQVLRSFEAWVEKKVQATTDSPPTSSHELLQSIAKIPNTHSLSTDQDRLQVASCIAVNAE